MHQHVLVALEVTKEVRRCVAFQQRVAKGGDGFFEAFGGPCD